MAEKSSELELTNETGAMVESDDIAAKNITDNHAVNTNDGETTDDAQQIRVQIEETRSHLSETIDAIQDKLSVANLTEQVKDQVSEQIGTVVESAKDALFDKTSAVAKSIGKGLAGIGASGLAKTTQENPWITSVIGMGIGAVLVGVFFGGTQNRKKKTALRYKKFDGGNRPGDRYTNHTRQQFASEESTESAFQAARSRVGEAADTVSESVGSTASSALSSVSGIAGSAYQGVGSAAGKTYEQVGKASSFAYEKAGELGGEMKKNYEQYIEENPLVVGAVAFAVGAAIGYAIPATKIENQYLGEARDNVLEKAQATAQDAIGSVTQVVGEAQKLIVDEVNKQVEEVKSQSAT